MDTTKINAIVMTNRGLVRKSNQDNFYFNSKILHRDDSFDYKDSYSKQDREHVFVICNGVGDQNLGEKASYLATDIFQKILVRSAQDNVSLKKRIDLTNYAIKEASKEISILADDKNKDININADNDTVGTTFCCLQIIDNKAVAINVGDASSAYLFRNRGLHQITINNCQIEDIINSDTKSLEESTRYGSQHPPTNYLGTSNSPEEVNGSVSDIIDIDEKDIFLLCSDGLTDMVSHQTIVDILSQDASINTHAKRLMREALSNGGKDNITIILVEIEEKVTQTESIQQSKKNIADSPAKKVTKSRMRKKIPLILTAALTVVGTSAFFDNNIDNKMMSFFRKPTLLTLKSSFSEITPSPIAEPAIASTIKLNLTPEPADTPIIMPVATPPIVTPIVATPAVKRTAMPIVRPTSMAVASSNNAKPKVKPENATKLSSVPKATSRPISTPLIKVKAAPTTMPGR